MTDPGKTSKRGRLTLVKDSQGLLSTVRQKDMNGREDLMVTVFRCVATSNNSTGWFLFFTGTPLKVLSVGLHSKSH